MLHPTMLLKSGLQIILHQTLSRPVANFSFEILEQALEYLPEQ